MPSAELSRALVGCSGFVGSVLARQTAFDGLYRSSNIQDMAGKCFDLVVCAAAPAQKWIANRDPAADRENVGRLIRNLASVKARTFVLISTVDVFKEPVGVDEGSAVDEDGLNPYGLHRHQLEKFVAERFTHRLIVRLPGLVGPGLRKNVIFDLLHRNNLHALDSRAIFQFYPMVNLWYDISMALEAALSVVHLTAEPISVGDVSSRAFNRPFDQVLPRPPAVYDMRSCFADVFGGKRHYQYSRRESLQAIRAYAQSEPRKPTLESDPGR